MLALLRVRGCRQSLLQYRLQAAVAQDVDAKRGRDHVELPKNFDYASEEKLYNWWEQKGYFQPDMQAEGEPFVISMPPPNVTGKLHMGHAMFSTLQDIMIRHARMLGRKTLWVPGTDHAGIATQTVVEKMLVKEGTSRQALGREAFTQRVWEWKQQYGGFITDQLRRLGASCDWTRERFTLDEGLSNAVSEAFFRLHEKGLVYRGKYMVNWSPLMQTAVSDLEVEYSEEPGFLYKFKYPLAGGEGEFLPVATTRPETILGDTAVAVNPGDVRYSALVGRHCVVPGSGRLIPVIADDYVDMEFGTGVLKITPGHDPSDYEIGVRRGLEVLSVMNKDASMSAAAGPYAGLDRFDARQRIWQDLTQQGLAISKENYTIRVPRSQRGGEVIEPLVSEQWFVRAAPLARAALAAVEDGRIAIVPQRFARIYNNWLEDIKDWCVSRQLWWGHRIPVWYVFDNEDEALAAPDGRCDRFVVARSGQEALTLARGKYGQDVALRQEEDVLDTWFSSALWPFSTLGWPNEQDQDYKTFYPTQVMETGHDILFFWVARMAMMGLEFTGRAPFHSVYLHGLVRDAQGRKMSKSLGNVVDPLTVMAHVGADALRMTLATGTTVGQDLNLSEERLSANRNFANKLWNVGKFVLFNLSAVSDSEWQALARADFSADGALTGLPLAERWILSSLHELVARVSARHERLDLSEAGQQSLDWVWGELADWYVEAAKARLYGGHDAAAASSRAVLVYCLDTALRLLHPFMPFITEELWQALPHSGEALIAARWPRCGAPVDQGALEQFNALKGVVRAVRNARADYGVEPAKKLSGARVAAASPVLRAALLSEASALALLAKLDGVEVCSLEQQRGPAHDTTCVTLVVAEGLQVVLPLAGLFDVVKETARLNKQKAKLEKELSGISARLDNPNFSAKATAAVVAETRAQQAKVAQQLALVTQKLQQAQQLQC